MFSMAAIHDSYTKAARCIPYRLKIALRSHRQTFKRESTEATNTTAHEYFDCGEASMFSVVAIHDSHTNVAKDAPHTLKVILRISRALLERRPAAVFDTTI